MINDRGYYSLPKQERLELEEFAKGLRNGTSKVGRIISQESIRKSAENIYRIYLENMVAHRAAILLD